MTNEGPELIAVDGLVADAVTGEVFDWPEGVPGTGPGRIAYLIGLKRSAREAKETFETAERTYQHVVNHLLREAGVKGLKTEYGNATSVDATTITHAHAKKVAEAVAAELLSDEEAADLLLRAAKELDAKEVEKWIDSRLYDAEVADRMRATLKAVLLTSTPRASYALITPPSPPRVPKVSRPPRDLLPDLAYSVEQLEAERLNGKDAVALEQERVKA